MLVGESLPSDEEIIKQVAPESLSMGISQTKVASEWEAAVQRLHSRMESPHPVGIRSHLPMEAGIPVGIILLMDRKAGTSVEIKSPRRRPYPWRACLPGAWRWPLSAR